MPDDQAPLIDMAALAKMVDAGAPLDDESWVEWFRVWCHFDPASAAAWLRAKHDELGERFVSLLQRIATRLEDDFENERPSVAGTFMTAQGLESWLPLLLNAAASTPERHEGVWVSSGRDGLRHLRDRCVRRLAADPSLEANLALRRLIERADLARHTRALQDALESQLEAAVEAAAVPWTEEEVLRVESGDERRPRTPQDLFHLVEKHLRQVAALVENDDFSCRVMLRERKEPDIQRWVALSLKLVSRGFYSVVRENEVDDDKEVDISAFAPPLPRVPIEIKPTSGQSVASLQAFITEQLYGKYMRPDEVKFGVFLLVRDNDKAWTINSVRERPFAEAVALLSAHAEDLGRRVGKVIVVRAIDLMSAPHGLAARG